MDCLSTTFHFLKEGYSFVLLRDPWAGQKNRFNLLRHGREADEVTIIGRELSAEHCFRLIRKEMGLKRPPTRTALDGHGATP